MSRPVSDGDTALREMIPDFAGKLRRFGLRGEDSWFVVVGGEQRLYLVRDGKMEKTYPVSTSRRGFGNQKNSWKTPLGVHRVAQKIGSGAVTGTVFRSRKATGEIAKIVPEPVSTGLDLITTRILWLEGLEEGVNRGGECDTYRRYIYVHGTPEEGLIGVPVSNGCIRMRNADVIDFYDRVREGTLGVIVENTRFYSRMKECD